jgi:FkbM family methyltransferase
MTLRRILRNVVERRPSLAAAYRAMREEIYLLRMQPEPTPHGFLLAGDASMRNGSFEPVETELLREMIARSDCFIDVGANVGFYTCLARSLGRPAISFEPLERNLRVLYRNLEANGWTDAEVWPIGLGESPAIVPLYGGGTGASLLRNWSGASSAWHQSIPINTLDTVLGDRLEGRRLAIKIDVEGAELGVLRGALRTLSREPKPEWLIEITLTTHRPAMNAQFRETFDLFWNRGYEARAADSQTALVTPSDVEKWIAAGGSGVPVYSWLFRAVGAR